MQTQTTIRRSQGLETRVGPPRGRSTVMKVFLETHMGMQHRGLTELAKRVRIYVDKMPHGTLLCFVSKSRLALKLLACNATENPVLAYKRFASPIADLDVLEEIPKAFNQQSNISLGQGLESALEAI